jgi:signal transduction histidine kinase
MALYKRKTYLINKRFQLKFSLFLALVVILSSIVYPMTIYELYGSVSASLSSQFPHASQEFMSKRSDILQMLILWQITFAILIFVIGIFLSHKIAGPIYKIQKFIRGIKDTNQHDKLILRNGDHFTEVAKDYNKTITYLNTKNENIYEGLNSLKALINKPHDDSLLTEINDKIDKLIQEVE